MIVGLLFGVLSTALVAGVAAAVFSPLFGAGVGAVVALGFFYSLSFCKASALFYFWAWTSGFDTFGSTTFLTVSLAPSFAPPALTKSKLSMPWILCLIGPGTWIFKRRHSVSDTGCHLFSLRMLKATSRGSEGSAASLDRSSWPGAGLWVAGGWDLIEPAFCKGCLGSADFWADVDGCFANLGSLEISGFCGLAS